MTSAQETKTIMDNRSKRGSFSDVGSVSSLADRQRSGNTGRGSLLHRTGSIDDIEESSPTSSRGVGIREMDGGSRGDGNGSGNHESKGTKDEHELIPAWSDLKTKAGKERKRLPLACIACRRKKIRCSGEKPACKHCLRSRIPCVYKVTTRKAAPRTDYMTMLDKRLKRMEERVIKIIPNTDPVKMASIGRAIVKPLGPQSAKSGSAKKRAAEEAFGNEVNNWASSAPKSDVNRHLAGAEHVENTLLSEGLEYLPSKEIQEHLAEVFFDCLYGQSYHILHKPSFMWKLK